MGLPSGAVRSLLVLSLGALAVTASARPPLPETARGVVILTVAFVSAWTTRSGLLLLAARKRLVPLDEKAPLHRLARTAGATAVLASLLAAPLVVTPSHWSRLPILAAAIVGIAAGAFFARRDDRPRRPRTSSRAAWLLADTAFPAGILAALMGVDVAFLRLHDAAQVSPGTAARHLAGSVFLYALLLGLGGLSKAFSEKAAGLVLVDEVTVQTPGPLVVGGMLGVGFLFAGPALLPTLSLTNLLGLKALVGFFAGGGLSLLGALQGQRLAARSAGMPPSSHEAPR